jgi:topoisomerase IV subunit B
MSVVTALSDWLVHSNRRQSGAWTQRYECGVPVTELTPAPPGRSGTTVHFHPDPVLVPPGLDVAELRRLGAGFDSPLALEIEI